MSAKSVATYAEDIVRCKSLLKESVQTDIDGNSVNKYESQLTAVANREASTVTIELDDVQEFDHDLADAMMNNTKRYQEMVSQAIDEVVKPEENLEVEDTTPLDVFIRHRNILREQHPEEERKRYPASLLRRYNVVFVPPSQDKLMSIRQVEAAHIGKLVQLEGIVIRSTAVKPQITVATYACERCNSEIYQEVTGPTFMPMGVCTSDTCVTNKWNGRLQMMCRGSKFRKFQELKVQELAKDVPTGHVPRSMTVYAYGDVTRQAAPGDQVVISGIYLPTPHQGFKAIRAGLLSDTYLEAQSIEKVKKSYADNVIDDDMRDELHLLSTEVDIMDRLAQSIGPAIWGLEDVKKALLLLLIGGVSRDLADGMKIRGCINVCLVGDPGVAKSQLLKEVCALAPRGIYTTGRGSSGVGLTAAVTKDQYTGELMLEGGALVLADMGICCIDEFDKMDESDRTSIHEVMEQQTVSIAKAGITTSLNARASILAAANPLYGRYNPHKTTTQNVNLPTALLSRFDLLFLMLDRPDMDNDIRLAEHICHVHIHNDYPELLVKAMSKEQVRNYISIAKTYDPIISPDLLNHIVGAYLTMRKAMIENPDIQYTGARTLLAVLRLSTSIARLHFRDTVEKDDVDEALRLMHASKSSIDDSKEGEREVGDPTDEIFQILTTLRAASGSDEIDLEAAKQQTVREGFNPDQFDDTVAQYQDHNVLMVNEAQTKIVFV